MIGRQRARALEDEMFALCGLENLTDHFPRQMSGDLKQRVSLAACWLTFPPFS